MDNQQVEEANIGLKTDKERELALYSPFNIHVEEDGENKQYIATCHEAVIVAIGNSPINALFAFLSEMDELRKLGDEERTKQYISNDWNIKAALQLAFNYGKGSKYNWFTIEQATKKSATWLGEKKTQLQIAEHIQTLIMFRNCRSKQEENGVIKFQIMIKRMDMLKYICEERTIFMNKIAILDQQEERLMKEQEFVDQAQPGEIVPYKEVVKAMNDEGTKTAGSDSGE